MFNNNLVKWYHMKRILFFIVLFMSFTISFAKDKEVELIVQGQGNTKGEAVVNALQNALAQVNGTFISSSSTVTNDELAASDAAISFGKVTDYNVLNQYVANKVVYVTVKAKVLLTKNLKIQKSKGVYNSFNGSEFLDKSKKKSVDNINRIICKLNKINEQIALENLLKVVKKTLPYTYDLKECGSENPCLEGNNYVFDKQITFVFNDNFKNLKKMIEVTLNNIGFDNRKEAESYEKEGYRIYPFNMENKAGKTDKKRVRNAWYGALLGTAAGVTLGKYLGQNEKEFEQYSKVGTAVGLGMSQTSNFYYSTRYFRTDIRKWIILYKMNVNKELYNFYIKEYPSGLQSKINLDGTCVGRILSATKIADLIKFEKKPAVDLSKGELTKSIQSVANVDNFSTVEFEKNAGWKIRYAVPKEEMKNFQGYEVIKNNSMF